MKTAALLTAALLATSAQAQVIFSDDFEANPLALNSVPAGWTVINAGTVDVIGADWGLCGATGKCIDLDGSNSLSGVLSRSFALNAGTTYTLSFDIAGNRRGTGTETGTVSFGTASLNYSLTDSSLAAPYQTLSLAFTPGASGAYTLSFANNGGDNMGAILDNVAITTAVPEPASAALMLFGLGGVALLKRRRSA
ncbi:MAG: DUF642 domain-containing protein [Rubrivivax sp.]|nr:MAG: DUF642 domain-containing protein [Rubrivivax sp.]